MKKHLDYKKNSKYNCLKKNLDVSVIYRAPIGTHKEKILCCVQKIDIVRMVQ